jgi:glycosyltransferase involved in cell wall biosynthesis
LQEVLENSQLRDQLIRNGYECIERYDWRQSQEAFLREIDRLCSSVSE